MKEVVQPSHVRAVRSRAAETRPPFQIFGRGDCTGRGERKASSTEVQRPWWVTLSSVHSRVTSSRHSSKRDTRSRGWVPNSVNSSGR